MKRRVFALIVVLVFGVIFAVNQKLPTTGIQNEQERDRSDISVAKATPIEEQDPLTGMRIVLDAGHGGFDGGAVGQNGTVEKDTTLSTVLLLKDKLEEEGATVQLTREDDVFVSLESRTTIAGMNRAHLFLSVHADGFEDGEARGMTTYYYDDRSEELATTIHESIFKEEIETENRGVDVGNYQVLRDALMPAVLLELGYITNNEDEKLLHTHDFQEKISNQIVQGIIHHVDQRMIRNEAHIDMAEENPSHEIKLQ